MVISHISRDLRGKKRKKGGKRELRSRPARGRDFAFIGGEISAIPLLNLEEGRKGLSMSFNYSYCTSLGGETRVALYFLAKLKWKGGGGNLIRTNAAGLLPEGRNCSSAFLVAPMKESSYGPPRQKVKERRYLTRFIKGGDEVYNSHYCDAVTSWKVGLISRFRRGKDVRKGIWLSLGVKFHHHGGGALMKVKEEERIYQCVRLFDISAQTTTKERGSAVNTCSIVSREEKRRRPFS